MNWLDEFIRNVCTKSDKCSIKIEGVKAELVAEADNEHIEIQFMGDFYFRVRPNKPEGGQ